MNHQRSISGVAAAGYYPPITAGACVVAWVVALLALFGWWLHLPALIGVLPGLATMKFNTALGFLLGGTSLWLLRIENAEKSRRATGYLVGGLLAVLGALTLMEYLVNVDLRIDQLLAHDWATDPLKSPPGRMSPATAQLFVTCGVSLFLLDVGRGKVRPTDYLALATLLGGLIGVIGYCFGVTTLYRFLPYSTMALHTSVLFVLLGTGVLSSRPGRGLMAVVSSKQVGGAVARRLLPLLVLISVLSGWLRLEAERAGHLGTEMGTALLVVLVIVLLSVALWFSAHSLNELHGRLDRRSRLFELLSLCNQAIVHAGDRNELFVKVCEAATATGVFRTAWIGWVEPSTQTVRPVAQAGLDLGFASEIRVTIRDEPEGRGPIGSAIREGRPYVCNDAARDPRVAPWREKALSWGILSAAAFPIEENGAVLGGICVYSDRRDYFREEEIRLLGEITTNISSALRQLAAEMAKARLASIVNSSIDAIVGKDLNSIVTTWNAGAEELFGYSAAEMIGQPITRLIPPDRQDEEEGIIARVKRGQQIEPFETIRLRKDGRSIHVSVAISPIRDSQGRVVGASKVARDITERIESARALRATEERLEAIVKNLNEGLVIAGADDQLLQWNSAALRMHGFEDSPGWTCRLSDVADLFEVSTPEGQPLAIENWPLSRCLRGELLRDAEFHIRRKKELRPRIFSYSGTTVRDAGGRLSAFVTIKDITARRRAEADLQASFREISNLKTALDEHAIVAITDPAGRITYVNDKFCEIAKFAREELIGRDHRIINSGFHPKSFIKNLWDTVRGGHVWHGEIKNRAKDGSVYWVDTTIVPFLDGGGAIRQYVAIRADITDLKAAEEALLERARDLQRSNEDLEQFAYAASHDLQEPLRAVAGCLQILQRRYRDRLDARADELIEHSVSGAHRMQNLINGLLDYSRVGTRGAKFDMVNVGEALDLALIHLSAALREGNAMITRDELPAVTGDLSQLAALFQNLIGNALKFRSERQPEIHVGARRQGADWLISVRDNGIGIDPKHRDRIFMIFQRLHTRREYPGTGIGLAICRKVVERHGGRIWVESVTGGGSTFCWTLPASAEVAPANREAPVG